MPYKGFNLDKLVDIAELQAYKYGKGYQFLRDRYRRRQLDGLQRDLDWAGTIPILGEPIDFINAGISFIRGNYEDSALSVVAMLPIVGWAGTAIKIQKHHIIPRAVYRDAGKAIQEAMELNGGFNLKNIPFPFHGNHPQYNKYVASQLKALEEISEGSIRALQKDLNGMINAAYDNYKVTGENLNDYFRQFNPE